MKIPTIRYAVYTGFVTFALSTSTALAQTAPVGDAAYPSFGSCTSSSIPNLPQQWSANALLTPFQSQPLQVARVSVNSSPGTESRMVITTDDVASNGPKAWYIQGSKTFVLSDGPNGNLQCNLASATPTPWTAPSPQWLANKGCSCAGSNMVTGKEAEAWRCPNGKNGGNGPEYDWYWFTKDQNQFPHRIINSRENNTQSLPVLGDASLVNFTDVTQTTDQLLSIAETVCGDAVTEVQASLKSPSIAGLTYEPSSAPPPPTWPNTAFANGALFAVGGSYTGMAIYYDWNTRQEVSKIKSSVDGSVQDTRLTKGITYEMSYPNGNNQAPVCNTNGINFRPF